MNNGPFLLEDGPFPLAAVLVLVLGLVAVLVVVLILVLVLILIAVLILVLIIHGFFLHNLYSRTGRDSRMPGNLGFILRFEHNAGQKSRKNGSGNATGSSL